MPGSVPKSESHADGKEAAVSPIASVRAPAIAAPIHATRKARSRRPAPMQVPTIAATGVPRPNTSGIRRNSSRAPVPYPATAAGPIRPARPVAVAILTLVDKLTTEDAPPTRRMSRIGDQAILGGTIGGFSTPRPDQMWLAKIT